MALQTKTVQIEVDGRNVAFALNWANERWQSADELHESDFPLIAEVEGRRYELYSDETFAEAETD